MDTATRDVQYCSNAVVRQVHSSDIKRAAASALQEREERMQRFHEEQMSSTRRSQHLEAAVDREWQPYYNSEEPRYDDHNMWPLRGGIR